MLGWQILIRNESNVLLGAWRTGIDGLDWIRILVKSGDAVQTSFGGYPSSYEVKAKHLLSYIKSLQAPTLESRVTAQTASEQAIAMCSDEDVLTLEAWDES